MKTTNQKNEVVNAGVNFGNETNGNPLFQMTDVLFGLKVENLMFVCSEGETLWDNKYMLPDSLVYCLNSMEPEACLSKRVETLNSNDFQFTSVSSIYEQTHSGNKSPRHFINKDFNGDFLNIKSLIPVILLTKGDITLSFRLDNRIIREILYLSEDLLESDKGSTSIIEVRRSKQYKYLMNEVKTLFGEN